MSGKQLADTIAMALERTSRAQAEAADPSVSAWVSANAGTGKTHVLTMRVLRLLLAGTPPERILCLTYTKAAAAVMSTRVFDTLGEWVTLAAEELDARLAMLLGRPALAAEQALARTLFTRAIETPGGLKVQTIHAFCERLLQRFPLEADVPPGFTILDDAMAAELRREAIDHVLARATASGDSALGSALLTAVTHAVDQRFDEVLTAALGKREWLAAATRIDLGRSDDELAGAARVVRGALGLGEDASRAAVEAQLARAISAQDVARGAELLARSSKETDRKTAEALDAARRANSTEARIEALRRALLTKENQPRSDRFFITKAMRAEDPGLTGRLGEAREIFARGLAERRAIDTAEATTALLRLASAVMQRYTLAKARRAALDFDDLIAKTASLLHPARHDAPSSAAEWVLYKLDGGLDHILVDESQDTSPAQWRIIEALAAEFYSGGSARDVLRTLFAVGDEKQSIYSFQGAAPEEFAAKGRSFEAASVQAGLAFRKVPLELSFRTVEPVLAAVDKVFARRDRTPGLTSDAAPIRHEARRLGQAGLVEIWPTEVPLEPDAVDVWRPLAERREPSPVARLAERIAGTIARWLESGERLESEDRPITAGDILILLRRRRPFGAAMLAALKARGIAVAGADRMRLIEQPAVADLIALGDFLTLPEDDLALATVLKSPLFGFDDDDLMKIAVGRKSTLWSALIGARDVDPRFRSAQETLKRWRAKADYAPPFEFLSGLVDREGLRARLLQRLGAEAADAIDELSSLAMSYDEGAPPSLTGFLAWLRESEREVKRDMEHGRNEVRIMTVHGAKGLEAPIVFLPDTCSVPTRHNQRANLVEIGDANRPLGVPPPFVWSIKGASQLESIAAAAAVSQAREKEEYNRLLYVAMTRARDRLYIAGFEGKKPRSQDCWYDLVSEGLTGSLVERVDHDGRRVLTSSVPQEAARETPRAAAKDALAPAPRPAWALCAAPREPQLAMPLAPSRLAPYEVDESGDPVSDAGGPRIPDAPPAPRPAALASEGRFLRGTLTHVLLQHLPALDPAERRSAAERLVAARGKALSDRVRRSIVAETLAIMDDPAFAALFGPASRAEVPIVATIPRPSGHGPALALNGQIDRLAMIGGEVHFIDYKTNRPPPVRAEEVAEAYLLQLAAYRLALAQIFPDRAIRAAILWTDGPRLMPFPDALLDRAIQRLWDLPTGRLDA
jgi:ATP-dependent helicase/nuclease subunit A